MQEKKGGGGEFGISLMISSLNGVSGSW